MHFFDSVNLYNEHLRSFWNFLKGSKYEDSFNVERIILKIN